MQRKKQFSTLPLIASQSFCVVVNNGGCEKNELFLKINSFSDKDLG